MAELFVWQKNIVRAIDTHDVVILHGNVRDRYIYCDGPHYYEVRFDDFVTRLLFQEYGPIRRYDPYSKVADLALGEGQTFRTEQVEGFGNIGFGGSAEAVLARVSNDLEQDQGDRRVWMLKYMHNTLPYKGSYSPEESLSLIVFQRMIENMSPNKKLILCFMADTRVPVELCENAHRVALVKIPMPDFAERRVFWINRIAQGAAVGREMEELADDLAKLTDGFALTSLQTLVRLAQEQADRSGVELRGLTPRQWQKVIAQYKYGDTQDYYGQISFERLDNAKDFFTNQEGVSGQEYAVDKTIHMLWKAKTNVGALLRGSSNAPRGVLFFCGPSGTGKTMLSKKLAKFVFGSEEAFHRFDMSEYQQDYTVSKLIGSPPGYVGYEMGGLLTNAVLEKPFSVVLFDEIEKAHPRIFDIFLQVLSDGRLTDSRGQVVFFSESIIIFTSNIGTRSDEDQQLMVAKRSGNQEDVRKHFESCVQDYFRLGISRPELLNRIGNNIVPFNYLDQADVLTTTIQYYLRQLCNNFNEEHKPRNLSLKVEQEKVVDHIIRKRADQIRTFGGRAVLNILDDILLPELARALIRYEGDRQPRTLKTLTVDVGMKKDEEVLIVR